MLALALLLPIPEVPVIPASVMPIEMQWKAIAACPILRTTQGQGSSVVIARKDKFAYLLTAAHVVPFDGASVEFYTQASWPKVAWRGTDARVLQRWERDIDVALVRCEVGDHEPGILPLAAPGRRPKTFPTPALSIGSASGSPPTFEAVTILAKRLVRSPRDPQDIAFFWETSRPSRRGRSGGPLLDRDGKVIGICSATQAGRGYYIHLDEIQAALKRSGEGISWLVPPKQE